MFKIKRLAIGIIFLFSSLSFANGISIYPTPDSVKCSKDIPDSIEINWKAPVLPVYGEGFETGKVPPDSLWDIISKNKGVNTWHINDQSEYVHSGSYSAICNWMAPQYSIYEEDYTIDSWRTDSLMIARKFTVDDTLLLDEIEVVMDKDIYIVSFICEDFEDISPPEFPVGWHVVNEGTGSIWETYLDTTEKHINTHSGKQAIKYNKSTETADTWFFTPSFEVLADKSYNFNFYYKTNCENIEDIVTLDEDCENISPPKLPNDWNFDTEVPGTNWETFLDTTTNNEYTHSDSQAIIYHYYSEPNPPDTLTNSVSTWLKTATFDVIKGEEYELSLWCRPERFTSVHYKYTIKTYVWAIYNSVPMQIGSAIFTEEGIFSPIYEQLTGTFSINPMVPMDTFFVGIKLESDEVNSNFIIDDITIVKKEKHKLEAYLCDGQSSADTLENKRLWYSENITNYKEYLEADANCTVPSDGNYCIGFHCYSDSGITDLYIDDVEVISTPIDTIKAQFYIYDSDDGVLPGSAIGQAAFLIDTTMTAHCQLLTTRTGNALDRDLIFYPGDTYFIVADFCNVVKNFVYKIGVDETNPASNFLVKVNQDTWEQAQGDLLVRPKKCITNPFNQDEWLISSEITIENGDILNFSLGSSNWGFNSPVDVLVSTDEGITWPDTLFDYLEDYSNNKKEWSFSNYSVPLSGYAGQNVKFAFRYLGVDGELMAIDDIYITNANKNSKKVFFVIPVRNPSTKAICHAGNVKNDTKQLIGYKLYRGEYLSKNSGGPFEFNEIADLTNTTTYFDTDVKGPDTAYIYTVSAIYTPNVESNKYLYFPEDKKISMNQIGYITDTIPPPQPVSPKFNIEYSGNDLVCHLTWQDSEVKDILGFYIYRQDVLNDTVISDEPYDSTIIWEDKLPPYTSYEDIISTNSMFKYWVSAVDITHNETDTILVFDSADTTSLLFKAPPKFEAEAGDKKVEITVSSLDNSLRIFKIYRSETENDANPDIIFTTDSTSSYTYSDTAVFNDTIYYYKATTMYDTIESAFSREIEAVPKDDTEPGKITNLTYENNVDTTQVIFTWVNPNDDDIDFIKINIDGDFLEKVYVDEHPAGDTLSDTTNVNPGIYDFSFTVYDINGNKNKPEDIVEAKIVVVGLKPIFEENFESLDSLEIIPPDWNDVSGQGDESSFGWQVNDKGSSQFFKISSHTNYAWLNDDINGQDVSTNRYLVLPEVDFADTTVAYIMFDYCWNNLTGEATSIYDNVSIEQEKEANVFEKIINLEPATMQINISGTCSWKDKSFVKITDICQGKSIKLAFHYNDNGYWLQGVAIDNVKILVSKRAKRLFKNVDTKKLALLQNYPNPFNPDTKISFNIPVKTDVKLDIYNIKGQLVKTLINGKFDKGIHTVIWNGKNNHNANVSSGIYFYKLSANNNNIIRKMILMK